MLHLEHINLVVDDIPAVLKFYQVAFPHWTVRGGGEGTWYGKPRTWVHFGDDYQYLAFSDHGEGNNRQLNGHSMGLAHFAYVTDNIDAVIERLVAAGFAIAIDGAEDDYRKNVYFVDPAGFEVEFVQYFSDSPNLRNRYDD